MTLITNYQIRSISSKVVNSAKGKEKIIKILLLEHKHHIPDHAFHSSSISYATVQFVISIFIFQEILTLLENKKGKKNSIK